MGCVKICIQEKKGIKYRSNMLMTVSTHTEHHKVGCQYY